MTPTPDAIARRAARAERLLLLIDTPQRVAALVGDIVESAEARSRWRFWRSVLGTAVSLLGKQIAGGGVALIGTALAGWFVYMAASIVLTVICAILGAAGWAVVSFVTGHTGFELVMNAFTFRLTWAPHMSLLVFWMQALGMWMAAPYLTIRVGARWWPGRELPLAAVCAVVWAVLATTAPLVFVPGVWTPAAGVEIPLGTSDSLLGIVLIAFFTLRGGVVAAGARTPPSRA
jgi:hypothetical protein